MMSIENQLVPVDIWGLINEGFIENPPVNGWSFYYDESNNFRKFRFDSRKPLGYNIDRALTYDFILGGVAFNPDMRPNTDSLMERLGIQRQNELKTNSILKNNNFIEDIKLERLHTFLEWILDSGIIIHFSALNNIYWSIADLIDEATNTEQGCVTTPFHKEMKDQLFFFMMEHVSEMTAILQSYGFPNLENENINPFARAISDFILENSHDETPELFYLELARQIIKGLRDETEIIFMSSKKPGVLIDSYEWEYISAMQGTPSAHHYFDHETLIEKKLKQYKLQAGDEPYSDYNFIDSKNDRFIQVSDVLVGLLGEYFHYTDMLILSNQNRIPCLSEEQSYGIHLLRRVLTTSETVSPFLQRHVCPVELMNFRYRFLEVTESF